MALTRKLHWETRALHTFIQSRQNRSFKWCSQDCCMFAANAVLAMTGVDIASDFRTNYRTEAAAFSLIKSVTGGTTVADAVAYCAANHGMPEYTHPLLAQRGDMVVVEDAGRLVAGIVGLNGRDVLVPGETRLKRLSIMSIQRAWKV